MIIFPWIQGLPFSHDHFLIVLVGIGEKNAPVWGPSLDAAVHVHCRKERGNNAENAVEKSGENIGSSQPSMHSQFFLASYPILVGSFCIISASFQR